MAVKNVTITLDEETVAWARVHAVGKSLSLSRFVGELLRDHMRESGEYEEAMRSFLAQKPLKLKTPGEPYLSREESHSRTRIR